ncbi:TIM barrel protein, partial [bacterium]|nr:TIM barrel protein [bacterium]
MARMFSSEDTFFGMENHGEYSNNPEFLQTVFSALKDSRIGITLDSGNFYWYGFPLDEVYQLFTELAPHTKHTHIKNISYPARL